MNSSTAARKVDDGDDPLSFRNSTNCLTDSCCSGVNELMTSASFSAAIVTFHSQYTPTKRHHHRGSLRKTHVAAKTKFKTAVTAIAPMFETSSGRPAYCLNSHVNSAFEAMET